MSRLNILWIILSNIWWRLKENAQPLSVLVSLLVLITMAWSVYRQTEFNKFQVKINQAGFEPSIDVEVLPADTSQTNTTGADTFKTQDDVVPDPNHSGNFLVKYVVKNVGTRNIYRLIPGLAVTPESKIDVRKTYFQKEGIPTFDLAPGDALIRYTSFPIPQIMIEQSLPFWLCFRIDFENSIGSMFHYFKAYPFKFHNVKIEENGLPGDSILISFSIISTVDRQADWSRLLPAESLAYRAK